MKSKLVLALFLLGSLSIYETINSEPNGMVSKAESGIHTQDKVKGSILSAIGATCLTGTVYLVKKIMETEHYAPGTRPDLTDSDLVGLALGVPSLLLLIFGISHLAPMPEVSTTEPNKRNEYFQSFAS